MAPFKNPLARSKTSSSLKRRISAPIQIVVTEDDEFPIRTPGTGIATPLEYDAVEKQLRLLPARKETILHDQSAQNLVIDANTAGENPLYRNSGGSFAIDYALHEKDDLGGTSKRRLTVPTPLEQSRPDKKKSAFRSVLERIFRIRRKGDDKILRAELHKSDPSPLRRPPDFGDFREQRPSSFPMANIPNPLRSHSVKPLEHKADELVRDQSLRSPSRHRSFTLPARVPSYRMTVSSTDWDGLTPRPPSQHLQDLSPADQIDVAAIGTALTSDICPTRRSRSLGHIHNPAADEDGARRRSEEIKYWRDSYYPEPLSPISSTKENDLHFPDFEGTMIPDSPNVPEPQPFNFGPLTGLKITQAASLQSRIAVLEDKVRMLEKAVNHFQVIAIDSRATTGDSNHATFRATTSHYSVPESPAPASRVIHDSVVANVDFSRKRIFQMDNGSERRHETVRDNSTRPGSLKSGRHSPLATPGDTPLVPDVDMQTDAINPNLPYSNHGSLTAHHYVALLNLITAEQNARQRLEVVVFSLQAELKHWKTISSPVAPGFRTYPTPSPDLLVGDDDEIGQDTSSFLHGLSDVHDDYRGQDFLPESDDLDVFRTPMTELDQIAFPEHLNGNGTMQDKRQAPRILSLGRITAGHDGA